MQHIQHNLGRHKEGDEFAKVQESLSAPTTRKSSCQVVKYKQQSLSISNITAKRNIRKHKTFVKIRRKLVKMIRLQPSRKAVFNKHTVTLEITEALPTWWGGVYKSLVCLLKKCLKTKILGKIVTE